jgi:hypothetical protein
VSDCTVFQQSAAQGEFVRLAFLAFLIISLSLGALAQDSDVATPPANSLAALLADQAPELQDGYASDGDMWMLYDWRFDLLSNGAQRFLLKKYGYLDNEVDVLDNGDRSSGTQARTARPQAASTSAAPLPGENIDVSQAFFRAGTRLQSETTIAVNGANILVGFNNLDLQGQAVAFSKDSGATWSGGRLPSYPGVLANSGDPVLAVAPNGRIYHAYMAVNAVGFLTIALAYSDDGGANWVGPINATASLGGGNSLLDKPWLVVDNIPGSPYRGNIYVACTRFVANGEDISFMRSTDGGKTFTRAIALSTISQAEAAAFQELQAAFIAVGPAGEIYVSWYDTRVDGIRVIKSTDGGSTFSTPVTAQTGVGFGLSYYVPGTFDVAAFAQIAVDTSSGPSRGAVYVTTNVLRTPSYDLDIMLARSGDGGTTWDSPVRVNNDSTFTSQFQPALAVAANGNVGVSFYDRRNDPNDVLTDIYLAISSDGGRTFPIQERVNSASWLILPTPIGYRTGYHGDYNQIVASGPNFYLSWADDRDGADPSVFMTSIPISGSLPDFTLSTSKTSADILPGDTASFSISASAPNLKLSATANPSTGLTLQVTGTALTIVSSPSADPGTYTITVTGDNGKIKRSTEIRLTVHSRDVGTPPVPITPTYDPSYNSQTAIDSQGNLHVVYSGSVIGRRPKRITYVQIPPSGIALPPVTLYLADLKSVVDAVLDPHVAVGPDGKIYVVWVHSDGNSDSVLMSVSNDNGNSFSIPTDVSSQSETIVGIQTQVHAFQPSIAVGKNGTIFVSFQRQNRGAIPGAPPGAQFTLRLDIGVTHSTDGGSHFSTVASPTKYSPASLGASLSTASPPALALDSSDNPYVVWAASLIIRGTDIYLARSHDGGTTFDTAVNVSGFGTTSILPRQPSIALDSQDTLYVAWNNIDGIAGLEDNVLATSTDGQKFTTTANLSNATYYSGAVSDWPAIQTDPSGNVVAVWREWVNAPYRMNDTERDVFVTRCSRGGTNCGTPINISTSIGDTLLNAGGGQIQRPGLAVDPSGRVFVFYDDDTSGSTQVMMWTSPQGFSNTVTGVTQTNF